MIKLIIIPLMIFVFVVFSVSAAKLEKTEKMITFIEKHKIKKVAKTVDIQVSAIQDTEESIGRPVVFEVINASLDKKEITRLSNFVSKPNNIGFSSKHGMYYYNDIDAQQRPLTNIDDNSLSELKANAEQMVRKLMGKDSSRFVFANIETDYVLTTSDTVPKISGITYRFTRKINGRHIIDNSAYVRISYFGNSELAGFEIVNPDLKPIKAINHLVKYTATETRLEEYAHDKNTAIKNGSNGREAIGVTSIKTKYGLDTYFGKKVGSNILLVPYVSFYSEYQLENGESFEKWANFCLDADQTPNLKTDMIENFSR